MKFIYEGKKYPYHTVLPMNEDEDEIFRSIVPDVTGDYLILEFHSSDGVKIIDEIPRDAVTFEA